MIHGDEEETVVLDPRRKVLNDRKEVERRTKGVFGGSFDPGVYSAVG